VRTIGFVFRFFRVVGPLPPLMIGTFMVIAAAASAVVLIDVRRTGQVLLPVLALQLFAASSGFAGPARRGYYDILLTGGDHRVAIALAHWVMSIAPGLCAWLWIAGVEAAARQAFPLLALAGGSIVAMAVVSTLGWACTVPLPRFSGAIGWMVAVVAAMSLWPLDDLFKYGGPVTTMAAAALVNPALLVGRALGPIETLAVVPAVALGAASVIAACAWIVLTDYPLEASQ
jgi:hypothetical protein